MNDYPERQQVFMNGKAHSLEKAGEQATYDFIDHVKTSGFSLCEDFLEIFGQT